MSPQPSVPTRYIDTAPALEAAITSWKQRPWLAVDTEFVREDTYYAKLCLVQIGDGRSAACIDALAVDLAPLWTLLALPSIVKVLHSASQDYEIFAEHSGDCPRPLFDTQLAASLLGFGDQIGYAGLIKATLGIEVDKSLSRTDWSKRPLSSAAIEYAADDVRHLAEIYPRLRMQLAARNRLAWLQADCEQLTAPALYRTEPEDAWKRLRGLGRLPAPAQHRAARLAAWREQRAKSRNRPRRWILSDDALYALALRAPASLAELKTLDLLPPATRERLGAELLDQLGKAHGETPLVLEERPEPTHKTALQRLQGVVKTEAEALGIPPSLLATRGELESLLRLGASAPIPALQGWRGELIGGKLLAALP